jgi:osmotically inducible protein OsmC
MWRVGRSPGVKAVGASTNARKITPPSQTTSDNSMRNRRNDMSEIIELVGRFDDCGGAREFLLASTIGYDFVLTSPWEIAMQRKASAVWKGGLKDGKGTVSSTSGVLSNTPYSFTTRFENAPGTNPEELIAAAHAACFSMALSAQLGGANLTPESISTAATLTMEKLDAGWAITAVHLDVVAKVPGASAEAFNTAAQNAKAGCPVSKVLNAKITMDAKLG